MTSKLHAYDTRKHAPSSLARQMWFHAFSVGRFACGPNYHVRRSNFHGAQSIYVVRGAGWVAGKEQPFRAQSGDVIFMDLNEPHEYWADPVEPWEILWVHFDGPQMANYYALLEPSVTPVHHPSHPDRYHRLFRRLFQLFGEKAANTDAETASILTRILTQLVGDRMMSGLAPSPEPDALYPESVRRAIACMQANLNEPLTLPAIAQHTSLSPYHLAHMFKRATGQPVMQFLLQLRLERAKELIAHTQLPIREICEQVGFSDQSYFGKLFKRSEGVTPSAYRRAAQTGA
ncbi:MAG: AraC family transcriptional regulator [Alicyclobacillus sp.]|nr:AraC family transcriptional regulator [Alicyclobacillus sp.]